MNNKTNCDLCQEQLKTPSSLMTSERCAHRFCKPCHIKYFNAKKMSDSSHSNSDFDIILCPLCNDDRVYCSGNKGDSCETSPHVATSATTSTTTSTTASASTSSSSTFVRTPFPAKLSRKSKNKQKTNNWQQNQNVANKNGDFVNNENNKREANDENINKIVDGGDDEKGQIFQYSNNLDDANANNNAAIDENFNNINNNNNSININNNTINNNDTNNKSKINDISDKSGSYREVDINNNSLNDINNNINNNNNLNSCQQCCNADEIRLCQHCQLLLCQLCLASHLLVLQQPQQQQLQQSQQQLQQQPQQQQFQQQIQQHIHQQQQIQQKQELETFPMQPLQLNSIDIANNNNNNNNNSTNSNNNGPSINNINNNNNFNFNKNNFDYINNNYEEDNEIIADDNDDNNNNTNTNNVININTTSPSSLPEESCPRHANRVFQFYCKQCTEALCSECFVTGPCLKHETISTVELQNLQSETLLACEVKTRKQLSDLQSSSSMVGKLLGQLKGRYDEMLKLVEKTHVYFLQILQERREEIYAELELSYTSKLARLQTVKTNFNDCLAELNDAIVLIETLLPLPFNSKLITLKRDVGQKISELVPYKVDLQELAEMVQALNFHSNKQTVRPTIRNAFGFVGAVVSLPPDDKNSSTKNLDDHSIDLDRVKQFNYNNSAYNESRYSANESVALDVSRQPSLSCHGNETANTGNVNITGSIRSHINNNNNINNSNNNPSNDRSFPLSTHQNAVGNTRQHNSNNYSNRLNHNNNTYTKPPRYLTNHATSLNNIHSPHLNSEMPSTSAARSKNALLSISAQHLLNVESIAGTGMTSEEIARSILPTINIGLDFKRIKMEYHCKFGEYGNEPGLFTEPSGVAVGRDNEILVADANNHRIQVFDHTGAFRRIIGQDLSRVSNDARGSQNEGDLVYPNRLAVNKVTGCIYVTERSPTHQVRVYDETGRFVRRFGAHVLQHPRGITVDRLGRIIVIECKVMRVVIFNSSGSVLNRFIVEKKVNFPNGVAVNDKEEIFISDNRRHGVVVFDYQGAFLRTIGGIGITNYPIGVGINSTGEIVVADNHNNFNVTLFTQDGQLIRALESRVKHAQCFDTALMGDGSIVLSSKDYRIYIYHYAAYPNASGTSNAGPSGLGSAGNKYM